MVGSYIILKFIYLITKIYCLGLPIFPQILSSTSAKIPTEARNKKEMGRIRKEEEGSRSLKERRIIKRTQRRTEITSSGPANSPTGGASRNN